MLEVISAICIRREDWSTHTTTPYPAPTIRRSVIGDSGCPVRALRSAAPVIDNTPTWFIGGIEPARRLPFWLNDSANTSTADEAGASVV